VNVTIRPAARVDLAEQVMFLVQRGGGDLGSRFVRAVKTTLGFLVTAPRVGKERQFQNPMLQGIRSFPVRGFAQHLVFYRITTTAIEVVRVIHGARDIGKVLGE
jgi:toxin ParE1/3/4